MFRAPPPVRSGRGLKILTFFLAIGLVAAVAALYQARSQLARVTAAVESPERSGAVAATTGTEEASGSQNGGSDHAAGETRRHAEGGHIAQAATTFPYAVSGAQAAASEGFLRAGEPDVDYTAAYVVDRGTGRVLYAHNADTPVPTASMAKMMTCLIAMDEIEAGRLALDDSVTISARAARMGGSQIYAAQGQVFSVQTLLAATMVQSANDAAGGEDRGKQRGVRRAHEPARSGARP